VPQHVAIVMDGNGRWATRRGLPRVAGHEAGTENIRPITRKAAELGIKYLTVWAFSTENWRRPPEEVEAILGILARSVSTETEALHRENVRINHIGSLEPLDPVLRYAIEDAIELTRDNTRITLTIAFNYGGRAEIVQAVRRIIADGVAPEDVNDELIERYLYTADMPAPDLIIRTSGEQRVSNFLIWQGAYAEYLFTPKLWPDFGPEDLACAVEEFANRERRFGGLGPSSAATGTG
jgi:undecaprenyl diphosphate synthase